MLHFMIVITSYINLLNLSWIKKILLLRNMEPLKCHAKNTFLKYVKITADYRFSLIQVYKAPDKRGYPSNTFSYFSIKTYVVSTH